MDSRIANIKLKNLTIGYSKLDGPGILLKNISACASLGEMIAVIGANGIGKSTLLRTITGLQKAVDGTVIVEGKKITEYTTSELALIFGFVGTSNQVSQNLTVNELVGLGRFPHTNWIGRLKESDKDAISRSISNVGLDKFKDRKLSEMSDGERQRANIARVLAQDSKYIILDEPTAFLDLPNRYELVSLLREIVESGDKTVIYTTHDLQIAINESDKIWLLNNCSLKEGAPEDLILQDEFSKQFRESKLVFNNESGEYLFPSRKIGRIGLVADKEYYSITKKALERIKLSIEDKYNNLFIRVIRQQDKVCWELNNKNSTEKFYSLYDLSLYLRKMINSSF